ncbi:MAG: nodulation efficiency protein D [Treponema sp.]|nr:MAG: nodulation efficiency protein D [Treponema sp.]
MQIWFFWLLVGIVCIGLELIIPGLVIIFFGFGAICAAIFSFVPFVASNLWLQALIFIFFSVSSLLFLRSRFKDVFKGSFFGGTKNSRADKFAEVIDDILDGRVGRIKYKGTSWNAVSNSGDITAGTQVKVVSKEGMTYTVEKV